MLVEMRGKVVVEEGREGKGRAKWFEQAVIIAMAGKLRYAGDWKLF